MKKIFRSSTPCAAADPASYSGFPVTLGCLGLTLSSQRDELAGLQPGFAPQVAPPLDALRDETTRLVRHQHLINCSSGCVLVEANSRFILPSLLTQLDRGSLSVRLHICPKKGNQSLIMTGGSITMIVMRPKQKTKKTTSWGKVASWYHDTVEEKGSYQKELILPNILRLMDIKKTETVLDLACGEGFFSRRFNRLAKKVIAADIAKELIEIAKRDKEAGGIEFRVASADAISFIQNGFIDKVAIILALQNIENAKGVLDECSRVLKPGGKLFIVLNHPAFRVPKESSWGFDSEKNIQYRRVDRYISELKTKIQMHPGDKPDELTYSFHRPLQAYVKMLGKAGFGITNMEEWNSNRTSEPGPRQEAENKARKEIPLFMTLEARKL